MYETKWQTIKIPQRVSDDEVPWDRYYIINNDTGEAVAEIIGHADDHKEDNAYTLCKRLNLWEEVEARRLQ